LFVPHLLSLGFARRLAQPDFRDLPSCPKNTSPYILSSFSFLPSGWETRVCGPLRPPSDVPPLLSESPIVASPPWCGFSCGAAVPVPLSFVSIFCTSRGFPRLVAAPYLPLFFPTVCRIRTLTSPCPSKFVIWLSSLDPPLPPFNSFPLDFVPPCPRSCPIFPLVTVIQFYWRGRSGGNELSVFSLLPRKGGFLLPAHFFSREGPFPQPGRRFCVGERFRLCTPLFVMRLSPPSVFILFDFPAASPPSSVFFLCVDQPPGLLVPLQESSTLESLPGNCLVALLPFSKLEHPTGSCPFSPFIVLNLPFFLSPLPPSQSFLGCASPKEYSRLENHVTLNPSAWVFGPAPKSLFHLFSCRPHFQVFMYRATIVSNAQWYDHRGPFPAFLFFPNSVSVV